jgi:hypothetical protein
MQKQRRSILRKYWEHECTELTKTASPFATKVAAITAAVRDGVLEKWLTYAKCEHLTEFQIWRVHKMRSNLAFF